MAEGVPFTEGMPFTNIHNMVMMMVVMMMTMMMLVMMMVVVMKMVVSMKMVTMILNWDTPTQYLQILNETMHFSSAKAMLFRTSLFVALTRHGLAG